MRRAGVDGVVVVVPANDEAATIVDCLDSIRAAASGIDLPVRIVVVADDCADRTAELAAPVADVVLVCARNVGAARRAGVRWGLGPRDVGRRPRNPWIASTDADSLVPSDWLACQLDAAARGAGVVAGRVRVMDWEGWHSGVADQYHSGYRDGRAHGHVHGANLGFASAVARVTGGFPPLRTGEDVALVARARAAGFVVEWSDATPVVTSARRSGRAPSGFADHLVATEQLVLDAPGAARVAH